MVKLAFLKALQLFVKMIILDNDQTRSYQPIAPLKIAFNGIGWVFSRPINYKGLYEHISPLNTQSTRHVVDAIKYHYKLLGL